MPVLAALSLAAIVAVVAAQSITASNLKCEHVQNPLAITVLAPRLSWWATLANGNASSARNQSVSAFEVIVSSSLEGAQKAIGDMWDTGKVSVSAVRAQFDCDHVLRGAFAGKSPATSINYIQNYFRSTQT